MENEKALVAYVAPQVKLVSTKSNYLLNVGDAEYTLRRNVDFGKIPHTKSVSLFKAGAEKILMGFGLRYDVQIVDSIKDHVKGFFYYECKAIAYDPAGNVFRVGVGSANTSESNFGSAGAFNTANSAMKKAKKRAIVDLALSLGGLSDCFTQDFEDENFIAEGGNVQRDTDTITAKQTQRIFAIAANNEISVEMAKNWLKARGIESTKDIKVKEYDKICEDLEAYGKALDRGEIK